MPFVEPSKDEVLAWSAKNYSKGARLASPYHYKDEFSFPPGMMMYKTKWCPHPSSSLPRPLCAQPWVPARGSPSPIFDPIYLWRTLSCECLHRNPPFPTTSNIYTKDGGSASPGYAGFRPGERVDAFIEGKIGTSPAHASYLAGTREKSMASRIAERRLARK